jgi:hypothetical protein
MEIRTGIKGGTKHIPYPDVLLVWNCIVFGSCLKISFPETTERPAYFVGFANNVGDSLIFHNFEKWFGQILT